MPETAHTYGQFITFEGGEGAGKSTQVKLLATFLRNAGYPVVVTREPGGSPLAEKIRSFILEGRAKKFGTHAEALLFAIARADHVRKVIRPALASGAWVVCDRFSDSTMAYQGYVGSVSRGFLKLLERVAVGKTTPDITFILDLPAEEGLARANRRASLDRFETENDAFHQQLRLAFQDIAAQNGQRCTTIDARGSIEAIADRIQAVLAQRYPFLSSSSGEPA